MSDVPQPLVLLVGHCMPDAWMLRGAIGRVDDAIEIEGVNEEADLLAHVRSGARPLVALINRKLDGRFDAEDGIALIQGLDRNAVVPVLVSDLDEAHEEARAAGGRPGFGKRALNDASTADAIRDAIATAAADYVEGEGA